MTSTKREPPDDKNATPSTPARGTRRYDKPRLVDYGKVSKLTQTGGITTRDLGSRKRVCL
jgi:hypothetical protein